LPAQFSASGKVEGKLIFLGNCDLKVKKEDDFSGRTGLLMPSAISLTYFSYLVTQAGALQGFGRGFSVL